MALVKVQKTIFEDSAGTAPAGGAVCSVFFADSGMLANLYTTRSGVTSQSNPITTGADGLLSFYVEAGRYDIDVVHASGSQSYDDYLAVSEIVAEGPRPSAEFSDVDNMIIASTTSGVSIDWPDYLGRDVTTVVNNATSNEGGGRYTIVSVNPGSLSTLSSGVWRGANHDLGGGYYAKLKSGRVSVLSKFGAKFDGSDDTAALSAALSYGLINVRIDGSCSIDNLSYTPANDIRIHGLGHTLTGISSPSVQRCFQILPAGFNVSIKDLTVDADDTAYQALAIQNESNTDIKDVTLTNVTALNAYRSNTTFNGGDGIFIRGGFRRVTMTNPVVRGVKLATGAGIIGSEGVAGIAVVQNFAQTLMPLYVTLNNPCVEDVYSEDVTYGFDQDGAKLFGIDSAGIEEGSCNVNGGQFKNCWGRSLKFQRPDGVVSGTHFYRDAGNSSGSGNSEIDFQRGGGTVRDITCKYVNFQPNVIVNSYQNQYDTYQLLVDGVSCTLTGTTLGSAVIQRFSQATADVAMPIIGRNIKVNGTIVNVLRYLSQNDNDTDNHEYAQLENVTINGATNIAQVYGNNSGATVDVQLKNVVSNAGGVTPFDVGTFSNAVTLRSHLWGLKGTTKDTSRAFTAALTCGSGTVTLNTGEDTLGYTRIDDMVTINGQVRVDSVSAPSGALTIALPDNVLDLTETAEWTTFGVFIYDAVTKNPNEFALQLTTGNVATFVSTDTPLFDNTVADEIKAGTRLYINFTYKVQ